MRIGLPQRRPDVFTFFGGGWQTQRVADGLLKTSSALGGVVAEKGVLGDFFVVAANSMAVSCFICAAVSFHYRCISSIISVAALVATALTATSWVSLRLVVSLLLSPTDLSS